MQIGAEPELVLFLECPEEEMIRRVLNRNQGRIDDNIETIEKRLKVFNKLNFPVINYYDAKGKLRKMAKYQEQGQLLEPYLENIICPVMAGVRKKALELREAADQTLETIKDLCILVYTLVIVCGCKAVSRFFPHDVSDLELAVSLLDKCHVSPSLSSLAHETTGMMETKCVLVLWLSVLVLIPFDILLVDTSLTNGYYEKEEWSQDVLSSYKDDGVDVFLLLGVVEALAAIFKGQNSLLAENLSSNASESYNLSRGPSGEDSYSVFGCHYYTEEDDMDVPEIIGEMMDELLNGLRDTG
ncbi:Tubulin-folding cofactor D [Nymphaea thermarum]|nr:Tubulin-folding cofactor D [Nymphaea thermarum]